MSASLRGQKKFYVGSIQVVFLAAQHLEGKSLKTLPSDTICEQLLTDGTEKENNKKRGRLGLGRTASKQVGSWGRITEFDANISQLGSHSMLLLVKV